MPAPFCFFWRRGAWRHPCNHVLASPPALPLQAYVKATGEGLGFELGKAEFTLDGATAAVSVDGAPQPRWAFHLHQLGRGHWASVARAPVDAVVDAWGVSAT